MLIMTGENPAAETAAAQAAAPAQAAVAAPDVEEPGELLVEEISIDGMCGVY